MLKDNPNVLSSIGQNINKTKCHSTKREVIKIFEKIREKIINC